MKAVGWKKGAALSAKPRVLRRPFPLEGKPFGEGTAEFFGVIGELGVEFLEFTG